MLLYTPLPLELVLEGYDHYRCYKEIEFAGVKLQVEQLDSGRGKITRILSTNPKDFLNPLFQPGNIVSFDVPQIQTNSLQ